MQSSVERRDRRRGRTWEVGAKEPSISCSSFATYRWVDGIGWMGTKRLCEVPPGLRSPYLAEGGFSRTEDALTLRYGCSPSLKATFFLEMVTDLARTCEYFMPCFVCGTTEGPRRFSGEVILVSSRITEGKPLLPPPVLVAELAGPVLSLTGQTCSDLAIAVERGVQLLRW